MRRPSPTRARPFGFSLVELVVVLAVLGIVGAMAIPGYQSSLARAKRAEAIDALTRLQWAQERFRAEQGSYALALPLLRGMGEAPRHFRLDMVAAHPQGYIARATAQNHSYWTEGCKELSITVADGQAVLGPTETCWNR